ncbi:MAG: metalloregulator ArsR/SmtB family transcription factor [Desulfobulbus sp.]|nr:metalloregulator ArsR/SmtB family transcription factor [Desulfobulbus sp.]
MTPQSIEMTAECFRALGEPMRLRILIELREGERNVTALADILATSQANISKHLHILTSCGFLKRRKDGLNALYSIADMSIFTLCETVQGSIRRGLDTRARLMS